ncbi:MAG: isoprenyl transferase [Clostridia bacterium]|nr:isoprenyl transferase [Clostridia bacterium]
MGGTVELDMERIPKHIAIIMDGNGRWAKKRFLPRLAGHKAGSETLREIIETCGELGVQHLTVYAFSTENWGRPDEEITGLFNLLRGYLNTEIETMDREGIRINAIGDLTGLPEDLRKQIAAAMEKTKIHSKLQLNIALNYGGRDELLKAVQQIASEVRDGTMALSSVTEETIDAHLFTKGIPDPELLIRTSGELRLSNFLLWQLAYSEFYFTDVFWPDFKRNELINAIKEYQNRKRRFGKL